MSAPHRDRLLLLAFLVSGAAALGYELLWTRLLSVAIGNEVLGVLGVLAGFFGGMALGAVALHNRVKRTENPIRLFAILELIAAFYAIASPFLLHTFAGFLPVTLGSADGTAPPLASTLLVAGALLLPATFCMGATLPALVEARRRASPAADAKNGAEPEGVGVGRLYGANTLGATLGVLLTVYLLLPTLGVTVSALALGALGATSAVLAIRWQRAHGSGRPGSTEGAKDAGDPQSHSPVDASGDPDPEVAREPWLLLVVLGSTGLLGVGLEVVGIQVLSQILENTIYTFANILAVYLVGTAVGSLVYSRHVKRAVAGRPATVAAALLVLLALATVLASIVLGQAGSILDAVAPKGASFETQIFAEMVLALLVFGPATLVMGATFSHVAGLIAPGGLGRAYAVNTLGSAVAPLFFALYVIPDTGYRDALFVVVYGYLLVFGVFTWFRRFKAKWQVIAILGVVASTAAAPASLALVPADEGWKILEQRETVMGLVIVSEQVPADERAQANKTPLRKLQVGKHFRMGGAAAFGERRMGHIPLLLHPAPRSALFLGVGTGATLGAVADYATLDHVDAVELVPAVIDQLHYFEDINKGVADLDHVHVHAADARRFVAASPRSYDVVVADLFHPGRDTAGSLYTREHFTAVAEHLAPGGLFAQWIPLYQVDARTLRTIVRTFVGVFGDAYAILGIYNVQTPAIALIGKTDGPMAVGPTRLAQTLRRPVFAEVLLQDPRDLLGAYLMDRDALSTFAGDGPVNTDLDPRVAVQAPRAAYEGEAGRGWSNLSPLLDRRGSGLEILAAADGDAAAWTVDVPRFSAALAAHLRGEALRVKAGTPGAFGAASVDAYLEAYHHAPEFAPSRGLLYIAAGTSGDLAERIYPKMLERTPQEVRVYKAYVKYLRSIGDEARVNELRTQAEEASFGNPQ